MNIALDVVHSPESWVRDFQSVTVQAAGGLVQSSVVFVHGPMGVAMTVIGGSPWWLAFWRDTGQLLSCWEDLDHAQMFADTLRQVDALPELLAGREPTRSLAHLVDELRTRIAMMAKAGVAPTHPRTRRPVRPARSSLSM